MGNPYSRETMNWTIHKFSLSIEDKQIVEMPRDAIPLYVATQEIVEPLGDYLQLRLWAQVNPNAPLVNRTIKVIGTGHPAPDPETATYVGTVPIGPFVWHVFDLGEENES